MLDVGSAQGSRSSPGNIGQTKKNQTYKDIGINYDEAYFLPFFYTCNSSIQHARGLALWLKEALACLILNIPAASTLTASICIYVEMCGNSKYLRNTEKIVSLVINGSTLE